MRLLGEVYVVQEVVVLTGQVSEKTVMVALLVVVVIERHNFVLIKVE
jgi:hypothetical protein